MKISTVLDKIDSGAIALPEFQRGYVWSRRQVRDLVALLLNEPPEVVEAAGRHGYRFFTSVIALQAHAHRYLADAAA